MRLPTQGRPSGLDTNGSTGQDLFDAVPTRPPVEKRTRGWVWLAARLFGPLAVLPTGAVHLYELEHFKEPGYDPAGITAARVAEVAAVLFLGTFVVGRLGLKASLQRW